ncbi:hypothetical protein OS035_32185 [Rhizobium sp. 268]
MADDNGSFGPLGSNDLGKLRAVPIHVFLSSDGNARGVACIGLNGRFPLRVYAVDGLAHNGEIADRVGRQVEVMTAIPEVPIVLQTAVPVSEDIENGTIESTEDIENLVGSVAPHVSGDDQSVVDVTLACAKLPDGVDVVMDI